MTAWRWTGRGVLAVVLIGLYAPIVVVFIWSFNANPRGLLWGGFSTDRYADLWEQGDMWSALRTSLLLGIAASTFSVALGTLAAVGLKRWRPSTRRLAVGVLALPLVAPEIVLGISLAVWFHALHLKLGLATMILAHTAFGTSYAYVVVSAAVGDLDDNLYAAALDCGATPWQAFWRVLVPLLWPSLVVAWMLVFALSFDDYYVSFFTSGVGNDTLPIKIFSQMRFGVRPHTNALFVVLFVVTLAGTLLAGRLGRKKAGDIL